MNLIQSNCSESILFSDAFAIAMMENEYLDGIGFTIRIKWLVVRWNFSFYFETKKLQKYNQLAVGNVTNWNLRVEYRLYIVPVTETMNHCNVILEFAGVRKRKLVKLLTEQELYLKLCGLSCHVVINDMSKGKNPTYFSRETIDGFQTILRN